MSTRADVEYGGNDIQKSAEEDLNLFCWPEPNFGYGIHFYPNCKYGVDVLVGLQGREGR